MSAHEPGAMSPENDGKAWKVPFRQVYTFSFVSWVKATFWCLVVLKVFPWAREVFPYELRWQTGNEQERDWWRYNFLGRLAPGSFRPVPGEALVGRKLLLLDVTEVKDLDAQTVASLVSTQKREAVVTDTRVSVEPTTEYPKFDMDYRGEER